MDHFEQEYLSVESIISAQHRDHKSIYNRQKIVFLSFDLNIE